LFKVISNPFAVHQSKVKQKPLLLVISDTLYTEAFAYVYWIKKTEFVRLTSVNKSVRIIFLIGIANISIFEILSNGRLFYFMLKTIP